MAQDRHCHCVLLLPPHLVSCHSLRRPPPALATANHRSSSSQTTPLLLSSVFFFVPSLALLTMQFDAVPSAPGRGAAVVLSPPTPEPTKSLSSSSQCCRWSSSCQSGRWWQWSSDAGTINGRLVEQPTRVLYSSLPLTKEICPSRLSSVIWEMAIWFCWQFVLQFVLPALGCILPICMGQNMLVNEWIIFMPFICKWMG